MDIKISDSIKYIGINDYDVDLFESQYMLENGMAYNSYIILDEKIAVCDGVDKIAVFGVQIVGLEFRQTNPAVTVRFIQRVQIML